MKRPRRPSPGGGHVAVARQYCVDVVGGTIPACSWVRLACTRHLADLDRADPAWPYRLDPEKAERVCAFIELLPHIKGPLAGQPIRLAPWQSFVLVSLYGWVHKSGPRAGKRRFREGYLEVPRGNGKSALLSGLCLYATCADGEGGAEVYSAATTRDQAKIVFGVARRMALKSKGLLNTLGVNVHVHAISQEHSASTFQPLSADDHTLEGLNVHFVAIDELHAHKTRNVYDVMETGAGKRDQPLMVVITTAGTNRAGICYEVRTYITKILQGLASDESIFGLIYTIDDSDDWMAEETWRKANPNWGVSVDTAHVARLCAKAMQMTAAQPNFMTKHLDVWVNADVSWMDMRAWDQCGNARLEAEDFRGLPCKIGLDLASKTDLVAKVKIFKKPEDGVDHFYAFATYYLPRQAIEDGRNSQYPAWEAEGRLIVTNGDVNDMDAIERDMIEDAASFGAEVAYDPWQALQMAQHLQEAGVPVIEYRNSVANFSAPMKEIDALVRARRWHHDGDPAMAWMISNVVCHTDAKDNIYPRKERPENKIDGPVAAIMAMGRHLADAGGRSFWDT